jgi:DnaJ-class molecular chaperone
MSCKVTQNGNYRVSYTCKESEEECTMCGGAGITNNRICKLCNGHGVIIYDANTKRTHAYPPTQEQLKAIEILGVSQ